MLTLISDEYKLQIFLFEKMGSRSIESAILGKVGLGGPEALTEIDNIDYDESITIEDIKGGFNITGGIFDYRKYEDRLSEQYYDDDLDKVKDELWPLDYTRVLVYRDSYKRLVSAYYWILNVLYNRKEETTPVQLCRDSIYPKGNDISEHKKAFHNFCRLYYVDKKISDGHFSGLWEQIPIDYLNKIEHKINLENFNKDVVKLLKKLNVDGQKIDKLTSFLEDNRLYFKNKKSSQTSDDVQRITHDYYEYYRDMDKEILAGINEFYKADLEYTGVEKIK